MEVQKCTIISIACEILNADLFKQMFQRVNVSSLNTLTYILEIQLFKGVKQRTKLTVEKYEPSLY